MLDAFAFLICQILCWHNWRKPSLYPSELVELDLWWDGPRWLCLPQSQWPSQLEEVPVSTEEREVCLHIAEYPLLPIIESSSFIRLKRVTAWIFRFVKNCKLCRESRNPMRGYISVQELVNAVERWILWAQRSSFPREISDIAKGKQEMYKASPLLPLHPFLDDTGLLRVGGRISRADFSYSIRHPLILPGNHPLTKLIVKSEHLRLLHAGPTLLMNSLSRRYHIISARKVVRSIARGCVPCRRISARPTPQLMGQLPPERLIPGFVFD